jgi:sulfur carrier protein
VPLISVFINGQEKQIPSQQSVSELLRWLNLPADRLAIELNRSIVRKRDWPNTSVASGSQIEIVEFVGGG